MALEERLSGRRGDVVAVAVLGLLALGIFAPALPPSAVLFERDIAAYWCPQVETLVRSLAEGSWPVWNPYITFGLPMWADPQYHITYPIAWLNLVLMPAVYYKLFAVFHCWFAAVGLYVFSRALGFGRFPAAVGGAVWGASGPLLSAVSLFHIYAGASWIGWVLAALLGVLHSKTAGPALTLGLVAAVEVCAGSGEVVLLTAALCLATIGLRLLSRQARLERRLVGALAGAVAFAALVSAAQWLPTLAHVREVGSRLSASHRFNEYWSMHPLSLLDTVVPTLTAQFPWNPAWMATLFEGREPFLEVTYLGVAALSLVLLAALDRSDHLGKVLGGLVVLFLLAALGSHTPVFGLLLMLKPVALFRYPVKALVGVGFLWGLLTAAGLDIWARPWDETKRRRAVICAGAMAGLAISAVLASLLLSDDALRPAAAVGAEPLPGARSRLAWTALLAAASGALIALRSRRSSPSVWLSATLAIVVLGDLTAVTRQAFLVGPASILSSRPPILSALGSRLDGTRLLVDTNDPGWTDRRLARIPEGFSSHAAWGVGFQHYLMPPIGARWRLAGSFDTDFTGFTPRPVVELGDMLRSARSAEAVLRLLRLGAVDYFVSMSEPKAPGLEPVGTFPSVYSAPIHVSRVVDPLPRVYVVGGTLVVPKDRAARALLNETFDPASAVILSDGVTAAPPAGFRGSARVTSRRFADLAFEVESTHPAHVVVVETFVSGWEATVDGAPAPVLRANSAFRAVAVPAGAHRVRMWYRPLPVIWGAAISLTTLLAVGAWLTWRRTLASRRLSCPVS